MSSIFPGPDATRAELDAFVAAHTPPPVENGPSLMCNACGLVRVGMFTPFCKTCLKGWG